MAQFTTRERWEFAVRAALSVIFSIASLWIMVRGTYSDVTVKSAVAIMGILAGYWLR